MMKYRWLTAMMAVIALIGVFFFSYRAYRLFLEPMKTTSTSLPVIEVNKSMTAVSFVNLLKQRQLISSDPGLLAYIHFRGLAHQLKAGIYQIQPNESAFHFLKRVIAGDVLMLSFRIPEGSTQSQLSNAFKTAAFLSYQPTDWAFLSEQHLNAEGLLLADTYRYAAGSNATVILRLANNALQKALNHAWQSRMNDLPYATSYELLIAASILEKEASLPQERRLIAGVMINRLHAKMPLQVDPTIIYALGEKYTGHLTHADLQIDSPYNTYRHQGFPPTPIGMVSKDALEEAAHPLLSDYLYFVAKGDGTHQFSATYDEQKKAIQTYIEKK